MLVNRLPKHAARLGWSSARSVRTTGGQGVEQGQDVEQMKLRLEFQRNPVGDEVSAITAVVRPILSGVLVCDKKKAEARL